MSDEIKVKLFFLENVLFRGHPSNTLHENVDNVLGCFILKEETVQMGEFYSVCSFHISVLILTD